MKAISPMIAIILLIAFTVAIGGILSVWFPGLIRVLTGPVEIAGEKVAQCAGVWVRVEEVKSDRVIASNPSALNITKIKLTFDGTEFEPAGELSYLDPGDVDTYAYSRVGNKTVVVRGLCLEEVPVEGRCSEGDICWE